MRNKSVERIMTTRPLLVEPGTDIAAARDLMARNALHHLPVVADGRLVGIVSATDLISAGSPPAGTRPVAEVMHRDPVSLPSTATLFDAAAALAKGPFHSLPVTDAGGAVVGIVTATDLIAVLLQQLPASVESGSTGPAVPAGVAADFADAAELEAALHAAERRHGSGQDPERLAGAVIYLSARARLLENVLRAADLYLHSGQGEREHAALVRSIQRAKEGLGPDLRIGRV